MKRALVALLLAGCSSTLSLVPRRVDLIAPHVTLPITFLHDIPIVEVSVDHRPLGRFVIDLGASSAILSERFAKNLHAPSRHGIAQLTDAAGKVSSIDRTILRVRLATKGATFVDTNALVVDLDAFSRAAGTEIDGILGWGVFANVSLEIDYANHRAIISHDELPPPDGNDVLPLVEIERVPAVDLDVNKTKRRVMLDTGAMCAFALPASWSRALPIIGEWQPGRASHNLFGVTRSPVAHLSSDLHIGRYVLPQAIVEQSSSEVARVGAVVLHMFDVTFDAPHQRVRFRNVEREIAVPPWKSLGVSLEKNQGVWQVYDVVPESPAASLDIKIGDSITAVSGAPVSSWSVEEWWKAIEAHPALDVTVERAGRSFPLTLSVFDLPRDP